MRVETVQVELRPRSAWEAMELGNALVRRNAGVIWGAWLVCALPVFALLNAGAWALDRMWLAALALWWLAPAFDRIALHVLSRAVFGAAPTLRQTLAAQLRWGWRPVSGYLGWRRFSPWRAVSLPVALLEGVRGDALARRQRVVIDGIGGHALLMTLVTHLFVIALVVSQALLVLLFVPTELLSESARAMWALVSEQPPRWAQLLGNLALWLALGALGPFQVGAGFGLYLNRRTELEAWDLEIAFRRLRARIAPVAAPVLALAMVAGMLALAPAHAGAPPQGAPTPVDAGTAKPPASSAGDTLATVFGRPADDAGFGRAVEQAYADPLLDHSRIEVRWQRKNRDETASSAQPPPALLGLVARALAVVFEFGLWIVLAVLVAALLLTARRWWPWMRGMAVARRVPAEVVVSEAPPLPDALPDALVDAVRALWRGGERRRALALLYRASVEAMAVRAGVTLVPGATEAECLRVAGRMPDAADRHAFAAMVRVWQRAAYGQRLPDDAGLEALIETLAPRFGWAR